MVTVYWQGGAVDVGPNRLSGLRSFSQPSCSSVSAAIRVSSWRRLVAAAKAERWARIDASRRSGKHEAEAFNWKQEGEINARFRPLSFNTQMINGRSDGSLSTPSVSFRNHVRPLIIQILRYLVRSMHWSRLLSAIHLPVYSYARLRS